MNERRAARWEGLGEAELAGRWGCPRVELFATVGSSNDVARRLAGDGAAPGTVVLAEEQVAGRGRAGRSWASPPGLGLWFSVIGRPADPATTDTLPLRVGMAVAEALDPFLPAPGVGIKWPNDLWIGERKLGGILCEAVWTGERAGPVIAGVGLNLLHRPEDFPPELAAAAISLAQGARSAISRLEAADRLIPAVVRVVTRTPDAGGEGLEGIERRDRLVGRAVVLSDPMTGQELARGVAAGIAADGALRLRDAAGVERRIRSGTVRLAGGGGEG